MSIDKFASSVLTEINKFRSDPQSVEKRIQSFKLGLSRLRSGDPFIKEIESFIKELSNLEPFTNLELNDALCKSAEKQMDEFTSDPERYENYREGDALDGIVPSQYLKENPVLLVDDGAEEPYEVLNKFLLNKMDHKQLGRQTLTNTNFTQIGIAHAVRDGDNYVVCIFAYQKAKLRSPVPLPKGDLSELKQAFDLFDVKHEEEISPKETCDAMKSLGYDKKNPELYRIMKELDTPENETVDWPMFANHIMTRITDKYSEDGIRTIFNLYVDDPEEDTVSIINLKKIIEELKEEPSKREIDRLLQIKGSINAKLTFPEFYDFMCRVYGDEPENNENVRTKIEAAKLVTPGGKGKTVKSETVVTTTTTTTKTSGGATKTTKTTKRGRK